jgi:hypothetical protein
LCRVAVAFAAFALSPTVGVGHAVNFTACSRLAVCFFPSSVRPVASIASMLTLRPPLGVFGVGQLVSCTVRPRYSVVRPVAARLGLGGPSGSIVDGVGQLLRRTVSANAL